MKNYKMIAIDGNKLTKELVARGLTKQGASREMGFADNYMSKCILRGMIKESSIVLIDKLYGIKLEDILPDEPQEVQPEEQPSETEEVVTKKTTETSFVIEQAVWDMLYTVVKSAMIDALNSK